MALGALAKKMVFGFQIYEQQVSKKVYFYCELLEWVKHARSLVC